MPFVLIIAGVLLLVVGIRNTQSQLGRLIVSDFTGPGNFFYWIAAIMIIGLLGEIDEFQEASRMFLALVLLALLLSNQGFFEKFTTQLQQGSATPPPPGPPNPQPTTGGTGGGATGGAVKTNTSGGGIFGQLGQAASVVGGIAGIFGL